MAFATSDAARASRKRPPGSKFGSLALSARAGAVRAGTAAASSPTPAAPESSAQEAVARADLWAVVAAARATVRKLTNGRRDTESIDLALEPLERALERLPR